MVIEICIVEGLKRQKLLTHKQRYK